MKIELELDNDVFERLEIAESILGIPKGELINQYLLRHTRKGISGTLSAENLDDIFNSLQDGTEYFKTTCKAIVGENKAASENVTKATIELELNDHEQLALDFFTKYDSMTHQEFIRNALHSELKRYVRVIGKDESDPEAVFSGWLDRSSADDERQHEEDMKQLESEVMA